MFFSDFYRFMAAVLDRRSHIRVLRGRPGFDVACITNFENELQRYFMGLFGIRKKWVNGLRFSLGNTLVRYIIVNSTFRNLTRPAGRETGKNQVRAAIADAVGKGAKVILFAAYIKRLFREDELKELSAIHPGVTFTIGDNGTAWALLVDVFRAIEFNNLTRSSRIMILGPNGFLGSALVTVLKNSGFNNLVPVSSRSNRTNLFDNIRDVELVAACSHHSNLRLTADIVQSISHRKGIYIVDVCRPVNFRRKEFVKCNKEKVGRQDAGVVFNKGLKYVFLPGALFVLKKLRLSPKRLYGCFSEATALGALDSGTLQQYDFMNTNKKALKFVETIFTEQGFRISPVSNYGKDAGRYGKSREIFPRAEFPDSAKGDSGEENAGKDKKSREVHPGYSDRDSVKNFHMFL